jgi:hypothetical protein
LKTSRAFAVGAARLFDDQNSVAAENGADQVIRLRANRIQCSRSMSLEEDNPLRRGLEISHRRQKYRRHEGHDPEDDEKNVKCSGQRYVIHRAGSRSIWLNAAPRRLVTSSSLSSEGNRNIKSRLPRE